MSSVVGVLRGILKDAGYEIYWEYIDPEKKTVSMKGYFQGEEVEVEIKET